jgi:hypothetical protein
LVRKQKTASSVVDAVEFYRQIKRDITKSFACTSPRWYYPDRVIRVRTKFFSAKSSPSAKTYAVFVFRIILI